MRRSQTLLIVDGDTPELSARAARVGGKPASETYAAALKRLDPTLGFRVARPSWPDFDAGAAPLEDVAGVVLTGSGVSWSADDRRARQHRRLVERVFAAGLPVIGSCYGLQLGCVVLGGAVRENPKGVELGLARMVALTEDGRRHSMMHRRSPAFDAVCIHRDEVARAPHGATILASNGHSEVQALVYEAGSVRFWGMQYHPELTLAEIAVYLATPGRNALRDRSKFESDEDAEKVIADFRRIGADPEGEKALRWRYGVADEAALFELRTRELANWLASVSAATLIEEAAHDHTAETVVATG